MAKSERESPQDVLGGAGRNVDERQPRQDALRNTCHMTASGEAPLSQTRGVTREVMSEPPMRTEMARADIEKPAPNYGITVSQNGAHQRAPVGPRSVPIDRADGA